MNTKFETSLILAIDSHYGVYTPQAFVEKYGEYLDLSNEQKEDLSSPDNEFYWETWEIVLDKGLTIDGIEYSILSNEDLWLLPTNVEIPEDFWI